jgi:hypothetical protein
MGNDEMADQLTRTGSEHTFTGPQPACSIPIGFAKKAVRDWMNRNQKKHWEAIIGPQRDLYQGPLPEEQRIS